VTLESNAGGKFSCIYNNLGGLTSDPVGSNIFENLRGVCGRAIPQQDAKYAVGRQNKVFDLAAWWIIQCVIDNGLSPF
jgi:hypothetical protein